MNSSELINFIGILGSYNLNVDIHYIKGQIPETGTHIFIINLWVEWN